MYHEWLHKLKAVDDNPQRLLRWLLENAGIEQQDVMAIPPAIQEIITCQVERLLNHEPLSKILQSAYFYDLLFKTTQHTLDPRLDTELMIDQAKNIFDPQKNLSFLDLGTGTGCILITLLLEFPHATGVAVDLSAEALAVAKENAQTHGVAHRMTWLQSDWCQNLPPQTFEGIFSNPPYIVDDYPLDKSVKDYDPPMALYGGPDGMACYEKICAAITPYCHDATRIFFEIGIHQAALLRAIGMAHNLRCETVIPDQQGIERLMIMKI